MKSGTTSLHHYLGAHRQLYVPAIKEVNFFVAEHSWDRGVGWYRRQYRGAGDRIGVDVSPDYSKFPHYDGVPARMASVLPDAAIGYVVREPVARIRSMFRHQLAMGREKRPIDVAVLEDPHYLETSCYSLQLDQYLAHYPRERIAVVLTEQLREDPLAVTAKVTDLLGIEPLRRVPAGEWNRSDEKGRRRAVTRLATSLPLSRQVMRSMPEPLRRRIRTLGHRPIDEEQTVLADETAVELRRRLAADVRRLEDWVPGVTARWGFE